jgi:aminodeoxyfutalosine synthase
VPASLDDLTAKVETGEPLSDADIDMLAASRDIIMLGMLASTVRRKIHGSDVTFVRVADVKLADLNSADLNGGTTDGAAAVGEHAGEVRIFQTPTSLDAAVEVVSKVRDIAGKTPVSAFCLFELSKLAEGLPVVLAALNKAGLQLITQAPIDRLTRPEQALEALADAGLRLARLTVNETPERSWADVCRDVSALQARLRSIRVFAPLARKIDDTQPTTGYEDVKRLALARLLVDQVETIQVDWALYGPKLAQVGLTFGADDIDSVSAENDDSLGHRRSPTEEIHRSIRAAGFQPIERDALFARRD